MTSDTLRTLLEAGPGQVVELLPEKVSSRRLLETMAAFANSGGGTVVVGAGWRDSPFGLSEPQATRQQAIDLALQTDPPMHIPMPTLVSLDNATVLTITIPAGLPHAYAINGRFMRRNGSRNELLAGAILRELILCRSEGAFEAAAVEGAMLDDLDLERVHRYGEMISAGGRNPSHMLLSRGCLKNVDDVLRPTVAGMLLFGREPQQYVPSAEILAIRYPGTEMGDEFIKEQIRGPLPDQIQRAVAFTEQMEARTTRLAGVLRDEWPPYPPPAVRETIVNAVAHRDYRQRGDTIRLLLFADRLECYSPGRLPGHVTVDNIVDERFSRNEVLVQVLSDMGYIERLGYGIDRMIRLMTEWGLPAPRFEETPAGFRVTLEGPPVARTATSLSQKGRRWVHLGLNPRQESAIRFLEEGDRITNRDLKRLHPNVSDETIRRDLADLVRKNLLLKIGDKRATFYILK